MFRNTCTRFAKTFKPTVSFSELGLIQCNRAQSSSTDNSGSTTDDKNPLVVDKKDHEHEDSKDTGTTGGSGQQQRPSWRRGMKSWEINSYAGPSELQFNDYARVPVIRSPNDVLIKVKAASINPIDVAMTKGYGSQVIQAIRQVEKRKLPTLRKKEIEFPITLGRDFSGTVVEAGSGVTNFLVGDEVYGVLGFTENGSHAEYTVTSQDLIQRKPEFLSHVEASSVPYVGLTCWSAMKITGNFLDFTNKKFLVLGGSGGVGTFAIQYLKSQGAQVVATCSTNATAMIENLGADFAVDYTEPDYEALLESYAPYDCILNFAGPRNDAGPFLRYLKPGYGQYITLSPPLLSNFDQHGFLGGGIKNLVELVHANFNSIMKDRVVTKWAFFVSSSIGFCDIAPLISQRKIKPVVEQVYKFSDLPKAYQRIEAGHLRGKIVTEL